MAKINLYTTVTRDNTSDQGPNHDQIVNIYFILDDEANLEFGREIPSFSDHSGEHGPDQRSLHSATDNLCFGELPEDGPTEAQRAWMAKQYLQTEVVDPTIVDGHKPHNQVCCWAFSGLTPQDVLKRYGDGEKVLLAGGPGT